MKLTKVFSLMVILASVNMAHASTSSLGSGNLPCQSTPDAATKAKAHKDVNAVLGASDAETLEVVNPGDSKAVVEPKGS